MNKHVDLIYHWWADVDWRSWVAHFIVTTATAAVFMLIFWLFDARPLGWVVGATIGMLFYLFKEIGDFLKYWAAGTWAEHSDDGAGDFLASFAAWLHSMVMYLLMG